MLYDADGCSLSDGGAVPAVGVEVSCTAIYEPALGLDDSASTPAAAPAVGWGLTVGGLGLTVGGLGAHRWPGPASPQHL